MPVKKHKNKQKQTRGKNYELSQKCKFFKSHMYVLEKSNKNYQKKLGLAVRDDALKICDDPKFSTVYVVKGVSSKPSGNYIVGQKFYFLS